MTAPGVGGVAQAAMFEVDRVVPEPEPGESPTVRRTKRQAAHLAAGRHPLQSIMGRPLLLHRDAAPADDRDAPGLRCGGCRWRETVSHHSRSYAKCFLPGPASGEPIRVSHGEATDVRAWWPACSDYASEESAA